MSEREKNEAFVTLATNDTYSLGCLVLGNSLRKANTTRQLAVMVTTGVSNTMRSQLAQVFDVIQEVNVLDSEDPINLALLGRPDLNVTFTKLHCWRLTQFEKCVFLDADTLILQNVDELFDREELSAAPDAGWPDCFNSGVFVFKPSLDTYQALRDFATSQGSFDGGDQGLLNMYFKNWATEDISKHLPFIYNVVSQAFYSYLPAFTQFKDRVKIVHFIGAVKPWHHTFDTSTRTVQPLPGTGHSQEFLQVWWNIFIETVQPYLDPALRKELTMNLFAPWPPPAEEENISNETNVTIEIQNVGSGETVPAVYPYKPPVVEAFYEKEADDENTEALVEDTDEENIIELTVIPRSYSELESHYVEEPISHINPSNPPPSTYSAPWITEGWEKSTKGPDPNPPTFNVKSEETKPVSEIESKDNSINETNNNSAPLPQYNEECNHVTENNEDHENKEYENNEELNNKDEENTMGLVGELATMSIQSQHTPAAPVSDAQRKLNWERGQIDYLGQDSFENIQRKIDETLNKAEPCPAPTDKPSPFAPKPVEATVSSTVQVGLQSAQPTAAAPPPSKPTEPPKVSSTEKPQITSTAQPASSSSASQPAPGPATTPAKPQVAIKPTVGPGSTQASPPVATKPTSPGTSQVSPPVAAKPTLSIGAAPAKPAIADKPASPLSPPVAAKPTSPLSPPVAAKPTSPLSPPVAAKPTSPLSPPVGSKPTSPLSPPVAAKPTSPGTGQVRPPLVATKPAAGLGGPQSRLASTAKPAEAAPGSSPFRPQLRSVGGAGSAQVRPAGTAPTTPGGVQLRTTGRLPTPKNQFGQKK